MPNKKQILKKAKELDFIGLQFTDMLGAIKEITLNASDIERAIDTGLWFDGSSIQGCSRIAESDMFLKPDLDTFLISSRNPKKGRIICDVCTPDKKPFQQDPRSILKEQIERAKKLGFKFTTGPELEFFLYKPNEHLPLPHDFGSYFDKVTDEGAEVREEICKAMKQMGIPTETTHHEVANGQHEIGLRYDDALIIADNIITLKDIARTVARQHGLAVTFMPKPFPNINGSGMHIHQTLFSMDNKNVFYNPNKKNNLSDLALNFIAGQFEHIKAICAIINPTINSYKRLVPGFEAPVYISYGHINRSALIRIPRTTPEKEKVSTRLEIRCPDPSCNPYLAFAVLLASGLDGVKRKLDPGKPTEENLYALSDTQRINKGIDHLPETLQESITHFKKDEYLKEELGIEFIETYVKAKEQEWKRFITSVTDVEHEMYKNI